MIRRHAVAAAILVCATAVPATAKPACYTPTEMKAMQFRQLQVELMVAALKCRAVDPSFSAKYASYVDRVGPALNRNARELRALFQRQGKGAAQMDRFMTDLSNQASMRSLSADNYCEAQDALFAQVLAMPAREVEAFAAATIEHPAPACTSPSIREATATKDKPAPSIKTEVKKTDRNG